MTASNQNQSVETKVGWWWVAPLLIVVGLLLYYFRAHFLSCRWPDGAGSFWSFVDLYLEAWLSTLIFGAIILSALLGVSIKKPRWKRIIFVGPGWALLVLFIFAIIALVVFPPKYGGKGPYSSALGSLGQMRSEAETRVLSDNRYPTDLCDQEIGPMADLFKNIENKTKEKAVCLMSGDKKQWAVSIGPDTPKPTRGIWCPVDSTPNSKPKYGCADSAGFAGMRLSPIAGPSCNTVADVKGDLTS